MSTPTISVIGLGKLGLPVAACLASKGFDVLGIDVDKKIINSINKGKAPFYEPGLQSLLSAGKNRLKVSTKLSEAIENTDVTFIIIPTPSAKDGDFSSVNVKRALKELSKALKTSKKKYHLFVVSSTVTPAATENNLIPLVEKISKKRLNKDFGVCYNPEFIALGSVIKNYLNPDMVLIGESNRFAGDRLQKIYERTLENKPYIARMSIINAEITKLSLNAYVTMKISFANQLAGVCSAIPGADIDKITKALGEDKRIGARYLKGGLSYGGPCFPRDNRAFLSFAKKYKHNAPLSRATDKINDIQGDYLTKETFKYLGANNRVLIIGIAYKADTPVIEESASLRLINSLLKKGIEVHCYDPLAEENIKAYFGERVKYVSSLKKCINQIPFCILAMPSKKLISAIENHIFRKPIAILDCWRVLNKSRLSKTVNYIAFGKS